MSTRTTSEVAWNELKNVHSVRFTGTKTNQRKRQTGEQKNSDVKPTADKLYKRKWDPRSSTIDRTIARMYQTCRKQHKTYQFVGNHILKTKSMCVLRPLDVHCRWNRLQNDTTDHHAISQCIVVYLLGSGLKERLFVVDCCGSVCGTFVPTFCAVFNRSSKGVRTCSR